MPRRLKLLLAAPALLCLVALSAGIARSTSAGTSVSAVVDFAPAQVRLDRAAGRAPVTVGLEGAGTDPATGWPERQVWLAVPAGFEPAAVSIRGADDVAVAGLGPGTPLDTARLPKYAAAPGEWTGTEWMRGTRLVTVRLTPLVWDPESGARLWTTVRIEMTLRPAAPPAEAWRPERAGTRAAADFERLIRSLVLNPGDVEPAEPAGAPLAGVGRLSEASSGGARAPGAPLGGLSYAGSAFSPLFRPSTTGSPVEYVIITNEALAPEFQRLADWRTRTGTLTVVRTVEWIDTQYPEGFDQPDRIRRFIKDAASRWGTEWVLLGGGVDVVPIRFGRSTYYFGENIATDLYYQCLDGNWNANGNDLFGEAGKDGADLTPEVWVSRIPLSTVADVRTVIDKTFQYERTPPGGAGYIPSFLALAEVLEPSDYQPGATINADGAVLAQDAIAQLPPSFRVTRMYENYTAPAWAALAIPEIKSAVLDSMSAGYEIIHHVGHGYRNNLSVGIGGQQLYREDVDQLTNATEPFLFYGINCNSAAVDYDCIAEHLLSNPHGGCFAYIGSTRFDFPEDSQVYQEWFYKYLFAERRTIGEAHALSKLKNVANAVGEGPVRWHQMSLICLGDPLVRMRSASPRPLTVTYPPSPVAGSSVPVTVRLDGTPLAGARVTLYRAGDLFATDTTAADGTVTLPLPVEVAGPVSLTATWINATPFETTVPVTLPAASPWLTVTGLTIDDSISGNHDGRLDPGETARLLFRITNSGGATAQNVTLTYAPEGDSVGVGHAVTDLPALAPGQTDSTFVSQVIQVSVPAALTGPTDVRGGLTLAWTGGSRVDPVVLHIGGVRLWVANQTFVDDPGGPGHDGIVAPGELVELRPEIMNRGLSVARDVRLRLVLDPDDHRVTPGTVLVNLGAIAPGASIPAPAPLTFSVSDLLAIPGIRLVIEADGIEQSSRAVDVTPPSIPGALTAVSNPTTIVLKWDQVPDADLRGYSVYRSTSAAGPFVLRNPVIDNPMGYYEDGPLERFARYYYRVAAQDSAGNLSALTPVYSFLTSFPALPNWPHERAVATPSSPVVHDLNGDGIPEIIFGGEEIYAMHADGSEYLDGDHNALTLGILTKTGNAAFWTTPAVVDVDGDGILDIVAAGWNDGRLYVFNPDGTVKPGWPRSIGAAHEQPDAADPWGSPLVQDMDGDGRKEIYICGGHWLYGFHADGTGIRDGDGNPATIGPLVDLGGYYNYGTPAGADFDHDGKPDVVVGTRNGNLHLLTGNGIEFPGFPIAQGGPVTSSPAIADLNKDGELEMIFGVNTIYEVHALNRFGQSPAGWPLRVNLNQDLDSSPTIADLDNDGWLDVIIAGGNGSVRAWRGKDGTTLPGFPVDLQALEANTQAFSVRGTPCLGDVTGDGVPDIVVGTMNGAVYGLSATGQLLPGFPLHALDSIEGGPLLWDVDGDGHTNIVYASADKFVYAFDTPGLFVPGPEGTCPWPMFRHDQCNSGFTGHLVTTPVAPQLALFQIDAVAEGVALSWRADGYSGWHVWRRETPATAGGAGWEGAARLTAEPLPGGPGLHRFVDTQAVPGTRYDYRLSAIARDGAEITFPPASFRVPEAVPPGFTLAQNAPNPFREGTVIPFTVGARPGKVTLEIFDARGRAVRRLVDETMSPGAHAVAWNGADDGGHRVPAGIYFYRLDAGGNTSSRKMIVLR